MRGVPRQLGVLSGQRAVPVRGGVFGRGDSVRRVVWMLGLVAVNPHSLTYSLPHSLTPSLTHSSTQSPTHLLAKERSAMGGPSSPKSWTLNP